MDVGLSTAQISALFSIWSGVGILAGVPAGALADRFSRRGALVGAGVLQAAGYALWVTLPGFAGFAVGFVLWSLAGALASGAFEALVYDGLADLDAERHYAAVIGRAEAAGLAAQVPAAGAATVLFGLGGFALAGWVSVGVCLAAAALALALPEHRRAVAPAGGDEDGGPGYLATLRAGVREAAAAPSVRAAVLVLAALTGLDGVEEYTPLLAQGWGVPTTLVPLALLAIPLAGALGALLGERGERLHGGALGALLGAAALLLGVAAWLDRPSGLVAVALFYGLYRLVTIVADARLQARVAGPSRATVTSVAALGGDLAALVLYATWAVGGLTAAAVLTLVVAAVVTSGLAGHRRDAGGVCPGPLRRFRPRDRV